MKTINSYKLALSKQTGAVVLTVSIILLIATTLVVLFASKVGVMDVKMSANEYRAKEAYAAAEAGLDMAKIYSKRVPAYEDDMQDCSLAAYRAVFPCSLLSTTPAAGTWLGYGIDIPPYSAAAVPIYSEYTAPLSAGFLKNITDDKITYIGNGRSIDLTGSATVSQAAAISSVLNSGPVPPLISPFIDIGGNMTIVANPHGGPSSTADVFFSAWVETAPTGTASWQSCKPGYFRDSISKALCIDPNEADEFGNTPSFNQCACEADPTANTIVNSGGPTTNQMLSEGGELRSDIVIGSDDPPAPFDDIYDYIFSVSRYEMKESVATQIADCSVLDASSTGIFWSLGDCNRTGGAIGSRSAPVIIIVEGNIAFQGNAHIWGLIVGIDKDTVIAVSNPEDDNPSEPCANPTNISLTGSPNIHGAMASDCDIALGAGTYNAIYDEQVFKAFGENEEFQVLSPIAASWIDGFNE